MTVSEHSRLDVGGSAGYRFTVEQNGGEHCKWVLCAPVAELGIQWVGMIRRQVERLQTQEEEGLLSAIQSCRKFVIMSPGPDESTEQLRWTKCRK